MEPSTTTSASSVAFAVPLMDPKTVDAEADHVPVLVTPFRPQTEASRTYNDWPFALLFIANVIFMVVGLIVWGLDTVRDAADPAETKSTPFSTASQTRTIIHIALALSALALVLSLMITVLVSVFTRPMVLFLSWGAVAIALAVTIAACVLKSVAYIILGVLLLIVFVAFAYGVHVDISFVVANVSVVRAVITKHLSTYLFAVLVAVAQTAWMILCLLVLLGVAKVINTTGSLGLKANGEQCTDNAECESNSCRYSGVVWVSKKHCAASFPGLEHVTTANYFAYISLLVSLYWGLQVLRHTSDTTTCGTVAAFWYGAESKFTTAAALVRSLTTSFGSICFGSLVGAVVQVMRLLAAKSRQEGSILGCLVECLLVCVQDFVEVINHWAYVYVAMYGFKLTRAGRAALDLFAKRNFMDIVDSNVLLVVLSIAAISIGLVCAGIGAYIAKYTDLVTFTNNTYFLSTMGFCVGAGVAITPLSVLNCAISTIFVCFAEDPAAFAMTHPDLYGMLVAAWEERYPSIMVAAGYCSERPTTETTHC